MSDLLTVDQVAAKLGCSRSQVFLLRKRPEFPRPTFKPAKPGTPLWRSEDIDKFNLDKE